MKTQLTPRRSIAILLLALSAQLCTAAPDARIEAGDTVYTGNYSVDAKSGLIAGSGSIQWNDGKYYEGQVASSQPNGPGSITWPNGDSYEGQFVAGNPHGFGTYRWKNGDSFQGEFVMGARTGQGVFTWENGDRWEGIFANNQQTDQGRIIRKPQPDAVPSERSIPPASPPAIRAAAMPTSREPAPLATSEKPAARPAPTARKGPAIYRYDEVMQAGNEATKVFYGKGFVTLAAPHIAELHRRETEIIDQNKRIAANSTPSESGSTKSSGPQRWKCTFICQGSWFAKGETPTIDATVWAGRSEYEAVDVLKRDTAKYCSKYVVSGLLGKEGMTPRRVSCKKD